jgi:hypothetical protein
LFFLTLVASHFWVSAKQLITIFFGDKRVRVVSAVRQMRRHRYLGWIISTIALCICISIRFYVDRYGQFLGSGALMPAIMIAGLFGGVTAGVIVLAIATFVLSFSCHHT